MRLEEQINVGVPVDTAWEHLHRIEEYPQFIDGVMQASARGRSRAHLNLEVRGTERELDADITDRGQERVMSWQTTEEPKISGTFALRSIDDGNTQVQIRLEYDPEEVKATLGGPKGFAQVSAIERTVRSDLEQFKRLVES